MSTIAVEPIQIPHWAWLAVAAASLGAYLVTLDNGILLQTFAERAHEFFHDGRHFLGAPCH
jgi:hypothetical protein